MIRRTAIQQLRRLAPRSSSRTQVHPLRYASSTAHENVPARLSPWLRRMIYAGGFGTLGLAAGSWLSEQMRPPPAPGTEEDKRRLERIQRVFDSGLPLVRELRDNPDYEESGVYENYSEEDRSHRISSGPMRGSRGLALQVGLLSTR